MDAAETQEIALPQHDPADNDPTQFDVQLATRRRDPAFGNADVLTDTPRRGAVREGASPPRRLAVGAVTSSSEPPRSKSRRRTWLWPRGGGRLRRRTSGSPSDAT